MISKSHVGRGSVSPAVPLVTDTQLTAITWTRNRNATVMMTKDGPLARRATSPRTTATRPLTTAATGTHHHAETPSTRLARTPMV